MPSSGSRRGFTNDALLIKNLTFYFGHMLVNITMYFGVAMVYEVMPVYTGRPWKTNALVVGAWNLDAAARLFAYLHHLYMDFAQPQWLQVFGQISSYLISIPAAVVTIFSTLVLVYGADMRWRLPSILLFLGVMGWAIGGVGAVIDSTVAGEHALPQHALGAGALSHLLRHGRRADDPRRGVPPGRRPVAPAGERRASRASIVTAPSASAATVSC